MKTRFLAALAFGLLCFAGCAASRDSTPREPTVKPDKFDLLSDKAVAMMARIAAGVHVTGERIAANDLPGAAKANEATAAALPVPVQRDLDWFRKLAAPETDAAALLAAKTQNAALLDEVRTLKAEVAQGVSPAEAQHLADIAADQAAKRARLDTLASVFTWGARVCGALATLGLIAAAASFAVAALKPFRDALTSGALVALVMSAVWAGMAASVNSPWLLIGGAALIVAAAGTYAWTLLRSDPPKRATPLA